MSFKPKGRIPPPGKRKGPWLSLCLDSCMPGIHETLLSFLPFPFTEPVSLETHRRLSFLNKPVPDQTLTPKLRNRTTEELSPPP